MVAGARLILASASPRRRQLLTSLGIPFRVMPSHASEASTIRHPRKLVQVLAKRKAREVAHKLARPALVLGADTVVVLKGKILGKPDHADHAAEMLGRLAGTTHTVYTGVALIDAATGRSAVGVAASKVRMIPLKPAALRRLSRRHLDKAGSYAIQETRDPIARVVSGEYDNVVGLPLTLVRRLLKRLAPGVASLPRSARQKRL